MTDTEPFALIVVLTAAAGLVAVLSNRLTERVKIPSPALVLAGAAIAVQVIPALHAPPQLAVERVVTVALVCILFDGGMHIGWTRFRSAAAPIAVVGVLGTFLTVAAAAGEPVAYDLSYAVPAHAGLHETYEWRIDQDTYHLGIDGTCLTVTPGPAGATPAVTVRTTRDFMRRWVAGEASWDQGRADGRVHVRGTDTAWDRMLLATGYPGRAHDLARRIFPPQAGTKAKPAEPGRPAQQDTHTAARRV